MKEGLTYKKLWEILVFDKRFNGISKEKQKKVASFEHVSAETLKELKSNEGDVRLISTGIFDGFTTEELAGEYLNEGEIITIPTGGVANIKYYNGKFVDSGNIIGIAGNKDLKMKYVYYFLLCNREQVDSFFRGVSIKHPYMPDICEMSIPLPNIEEQERIIAQLDLLSSTIEKQKAQLKELDNLSQAVFYDMFGDPVENEKGWQKKMIKEVAMVKIGPFGSLLHTSDYIIGGTPLVNPIHMKNGQICPDNSFTISDEKKKEMAPYLLEKGDVVFARRGEIGRCAIVSEKEDGYLCGTGSLFVRFTEPMSEIFVLYLTKSGSFVKELVSKAKGATMLNINCGIIEDLRLPIPPISLQHSFAAKIKSIEKQKAAIGKSIEETQKLFDYTMDKYFG